MWHFIVKIKKTTFVFININSKEPNNHNWFNICVQIRFQIIKEIKGIFSKGTPKPKTILGNQKNLGPIKQNICR